MATKSNKIREEKSALASVEAVRATVSPDGSGGRKVRLDVRAEGKLAARAIQLCVDEPVLLVQEEALGGGPPSQLRPRESAAGKLVRCTSSVQASEKKAVQVRASIVGGDSLEFLVGLRLVLEKQQREMPLAPDETEMPR